MGMMLADGATEMQMRVGSAIMLALPTVMAVITGWPFGELVISLLITVSSMEWGAMVGNAPLDHSTRMAAAVMNWLTLAALALFSAHHLSICVGAVWVLVALNMPLCTTENLSPEDEDRQMRGPFVGALYIGTGLAAVWSVYVTMPSITLLWLLCITWLTDIGALVAGRYLRGPLLCPTISPRKTWSGAAGGLLLSAVITTLVFSGPAVFNTQEVSQGGLLLRALIVSFGAILGDLLESLIKRAYGIKDSGTLLPGHGGLLDRIDSLLVSAPMLLLIVWIMT